MRNLALGLAARGAQIHVLAMAPRSPGNAEPLTGVLANGLTYESTARLPFGRGAARRQSTQGARWDWFFGLYGAVGPTRRRLKELIRERHCDLFICYGRNALLLLPLLSLCRSEGKPSLVDVTELPEHFPGLVPAVNPVGWDMRLGGRLLPRRASGVTVITRGLEERLRARGCRRLLLVPSIEGWKDLEPVIQNPPEMPFRLVYVGTLLPRDAPEVMLGAMALLQARGVAARLEIVGRFTGNPHGRRMAERCRTDPSLQKCITLVGELDDAGLAGRLRAADALVLMRADAPTEVCSFPTRLVEYLKVGRPVIVSDVGDVRLYLRGGEDAVLVPPGEPVALAAAVEDLAARPDRGKALGLQGRRRGAECFDRARHAARILEFAFMGEQARHGPREVGSAGQAAS